MSAAVPSAPAERPRVVIVGGGITGLAAAWELEPPGRAGALAVDLFEASSRLGGPIATDLASGHVLEGGADCFLTTKPGALELCEELGLSASLIGVRPSARRAYIYRGGRLHRIPSLIGPGRGTAARSLLSSSLLSRPSKLRMLLGAAWVRLRPIRVDDRSALGPQLRSRFGEEAVDWFLEPYVSGVHPAPLDRLSASAVANVLPARWTVAAGRPRPSGEGASPAGLSRAPRPGGRTRPPAGVFASLREGMEQLPRTLADRLQSAQLHLAQPVVEIRRQKGRYTVELADGRAIEAEGVVLAVPPPVAARLLEREYPAAAARLREVQMESMVVVGVVYDRTEVPIPLDGAGVLVPRPSGLPVSAFTWLSAKWDRDAHDSGQVALRVFLRCEGAREELPSAEDSVALARQGLRDVMGIVAAPRYVTVFPHRAALAWYEVGHLERVREVRRILGEGSGIEIAGSSYDGMGIPDAIRSGRGAARRLPVLGPGTEGAVVREDLPRPTPPSAGPDRARATALGTGGL